jgi:hypothetical protein
LRVSLQGDDGLLGLQNRDVDVRVYQVYSGFLSPDFRRLGAAAASGAI